MSESHWGGGALKGGVLALVGTVLLMAGLIALFAWSPWVEPTEHDWVQSYEAWSERIESTLATGAGVRQASCEAEFDTEVGDPPTDRMEPAARAARRGCAALSPDGWQGAQSDFVRALVDVHSEEVAPRHRPGFSEIAGSLAGGQAKVYCWLPESWARFVEHYAIVRGGDEIWLTGIADTARDRIDLDPGVCATLRRYERRIRPAALSRENLDLAQALVVLAHQAEHLKAPSASEQDVECYAVQHVRPLIRAAGWDPAFQTEIALHAWQLAYTQLPPQYQTPDCRNGGPLDRNPDSDAWP